LKTKLAIIFGGVSTEHEVSIVSAASVAKHLDAERFEAVYVGIAKDGRWLMGPGAFDYLKGDAAADVRRVLLSPDPAHHGFVDLESGEITRIDAIFPVLHGPRGEDGTIQGLFELAGIAYVGCGVMASAIAIDKDMTKRVLSQHGIPVVKGTSVSSDAWLSDKAEVMNEIGKTLKFPLFVKPATMGSSVGVVKVDEPEGLEAAISQALKYSLKVVVEQAVEQPLEIEVAVLGNGEPKASIPGQIIPGGEFYDYADKYINDNSRAVIPAPLDRASLDNIRFMAEEAFAAIGGTGLARVDFLVSGERCYVNEINTLPGFTSISMYPKLWEATGLGYRELISRLIELALERREAEDGLIKTIELIKPLGV